MVILQVHFSFCSYQLFFSLKKIASFLFSLFCLIITMNLEILTIVSGLQVITIMITFVAFIPNMTVDASSSGILYLFLTRLQKILDHLCQDHLVLSEHQTQKESFILPNSSGYFSRRNGEEKAKSRYCYSDIIASRPFQWTETKGFKRKLSIFH